VLQEIGAALAREAIHPRIMTPARRALRRSGRA
jgi:hypothetical protein